MTSALILSGDTRRDIRHSRIFLVVPYVENFRDLPDARRIAAGHLSLDVQDICDVRHRNGRDSALGVWKRCWWHWSNGSVWEFSCYFSDSDVPYLCCFEEAEYKRRLGHIVLNACNSDEAHCYFVFG